MSEPTATSNPESTNPPTNPDELFHKSDLTFFDSEDGHAGSVIGKMLSLFFLYTVLAMAIVAYWTFSVVSK